MIGEGSAKMKTFGQLQGLTIWAFSFIHQKGIIFFFFWFDAFLYAGRCRKAYVKEITVANEVTNPAFGFPNPASQYDTCVAKITEFMKQANDAATVACYSYSNSNSGPRFNKSRSGC